MMDISRERESNRGSHATGIVSGACMPEAGASARGRKLQAEKRLHAIQALWDDPERYDRIVASGRYLKLCALLQFASEAVERASERLDR